MRPKRIVVIAVFLAFEAVAADPVQDQERSGKQIVEMQCVKCHGTGLNGAPQLGDREAWIQRARLGLDNLVRQATRGHGKMPARGGMADLTDPELRAAINYMVNTSLKNVK
jgi:Cytochrome c5